jgi:hypothetical protein
MKIKGLKSLPNEEINYELGRGARFILYQYCVSVLVLTFKRSSDIYFVRTGESAVSRGFVFSLISLFFGWWGIPWGPIYTIQSLWVNFSGGRDVTSEVLASLTQPQSRQVS